MGTLMHAAQRAEPELHQRLNPATVVALAGDPDRRQRIKVRFDWLAGTTGGEPPEAWAVVVTPYADQDQGFQMLPEPDSTVVIGFLGGHLDHPYVMGSVWNGNAPAPDEFTDANDKRAITSRSGSRLEFDDTQGAVAVRVTTPGGHEVVMDDGGLNVTVTCSSGASIELTAAGGVSVRAQGIVHVDAAMVTVKSDLATFSGTVTCDTLIAKGGGVVSPTYTPGAGNVW